MHPSRLAAHAPEAAVRFALGGLAVAALLVQGCAATPGVPAPRPPIPAAPPSVLGVALIEPPSDVADLSAAVRHVLRRADSGTAGRAATPSTVAVPEVPERSADDSGADASDGAAPVDETLPGVEDVPSVEDAPTADPATVPSAGAAAPAGPGVLTPGQAARTAILSAWERYCHSTDLTPAEWSIIGRTGMPASLAAGWAIRCRPGD